MDNQRVNGPEGLGDNAQLRLAWEIIEHTGANLFLTGRAGTGKTTFLRGLRERSAKRMVVLAPTGIAAINAGGSTIHSFFQLPFSPFIPGAPVAPQERKFKVNRNKIQLIRSLDLLVIDEISMVRADLLDAIDDQMRRYRNRHLPFGGVQLLLIGDLQQLPPVVVDSEAELLADHYPTNYFFSSRALQAAGMQTIELTQVYRQTNLDFLSLLNDIRSGHPSAETLRRLNERCIPGFQVPDNPKYVRLTTHNDLAREINQRELAILRGETTVFDAKVEGKFPENSFPADSSLALKPGTQVMFIKNDSEKKYYNGMIGVVESLDEEKVNVRVEGLDEPIPARPESWDNTRYELNSETGEIVEHRDGSFSQLPLRLAWAITIHKSQGLTFPHALIDASRSFAHGQTYVALSRCQTLEGLVLQRPLSREAVICDPTVTQFMEACLASKLDAETVQWMRRSYLLECLDRTFSVESLIIVQEEYLRQLKENFSLLYPNIVRAHDEWLKGLRESLRDVAGRFAGQYRRLLEQSGWELSKPVQERLAQGAAYFLAQVKKGEEILADTPTQVDNAAAAQRMAERREALESELDTMKAVLGTVARDGFSLDGWLASRAKSAVARLDKKKKGTQRSHKEPGLTALEGLANPELYKALLAWRTAKTRETGQPAFIFAHTTLLRVLSELAPRTERELLAVPGVGRKKAQAHGAEWLALVREHCPE